MCAAMFKTVTIGVHPTLVTPRWRRAGASQRSRRRSSDGPCCAAPPWRRGANPTQMLRLLVKNLDKGAHLNNNNNNNHNHNNNAVVLRPPNRDRSSVDTTGGRDVAAR